MASLQKFRCKCGEDFSNFKTHYHEGVCKFGQPKKEFVCPFCGDVFTSNGSLWYHQQKMGHRMQEEDSKDLKMKKANQLQAVESIGINVNQDGVEKRWFSSHVQWYSNDFKGPVVTCEKLNKKCIQGQCVPRPGFTVDKGLDIKHRMNDRSLRKTGTMKGHNADFDNHWYDEDEKRDSMKMSNVTPQDPDANYVLRSVSELCHFLLMNDFDVTVVTVNEFGSNPERVGTDDAAKPPRIHKTLFVKEDPTTDTCFVDNFVITNAAQDKGQKRKRTTNEFKDEDKVGTCRLPVQPCVLKFFPKGLDMMTPKSYFMRRPFDTVALAEFRKTFAPVSSGASSTSTSNPTEVVDSEKSATELEKVKSQRDNLWAILNMVVRDDDALEIVRKSLMDK